jgi:hypothetical protein
MNPFRTCINSHVENKFDEQRSKVNIPITRPSKSVLGAGFSLHSSASNPLFAHLSPSSSNLANQVDALRFNQTITGSRVELTVNEDKVLLHNKKKALSKSLDSNTEILALNFTDSYIKKIEKNMGAETSYGRVDAGCDT